MNNHSRDAEKGKATTTTQQKGKATEHSSPETVIFQRRIGCLGWESNPQLSAFQATLSPTKLPRQLSCLVHTNQKVSQPDKQVNSDTIFPCVHLLIRNVHKICILTREIISKTITKYLCVYLCPSITTESTPPPIQTYFQSPFKL